MYVLCCDIALEMIVSLFHQCFALATFCFFATSCSFRSSSSPLLSPPASSSAGSSTRSLEAALSLAKSITVALPPAAPPIPPISSMSSAAALAANAKLLATSVMSPEEPARECVSDWSLFSRRAMESSSTFLSTFPSRSYPRDLVSLSVSLMRSLTRTATRRLYLSDVPFVSTTAFGIPASLCHSRDASPGSTDPFFAFPAHAI